MDMVNGYQKGSLSTRLKIPMLYGIDAVHGHNAVYKATVFPHNIGLGATRQVVLDLIKIIKLKINNSSLQGDFNLLLIDNNEKCYLECAEILSW